MKKIIKFNYRYDLIDEYIIKNNITKIKLCEKCEFSLKTLYRFYHGKCVFVQNLIKLVDVLNVKIYEFFIGCER